LRDDDAGIEGDDRDLGPVEPVRCIRGASVRRSRAFEQRDCTHLSRGRDDYSETVKPGEAAELRGRLLQHPAAVSDAVRQPGRGQLGRRAVGMLWHVT